MVENDVWKRMIVDILKKVDIIGDNFTGYIKINLNCGGITNIEKMNIIK